MKSEFRVLNGQGFVRVVDVMGDDSAIVQSARISYGKGTKSVHQDEGLIRYLMRHRHTTPFEMCEIKLHIRVPMDCWRQWIRHRTANVNEYSTRYSEAINECQVTPEDKWRLQSKSNKQGSEKYMTIEDWGMSDCPSLGGKSLTEREKQLHDLARKVYEERLKSDVAREQARKDLPLSTFTEAYWKIDLHNLLHFLSLRMDSHAQQEIREYATVIGEQIVAEWVPLTWRAFKDYRLGAMFLSARDQEVISSILSDDCSQAYNKAIKWGWFDTKNNREKKECESKLTKLGFSIPWEI